MFQPYFDFLYDTRARCNMTRGILVQTAEMILEFSISRSVMVYRSKRLTHTALVSLLAF
jgi:hypothetical protein